MTDTLRTRIAAVIHRELSQPCCDECHDWGPEPWEIDLADAVIRALAAGAAVPTSPAAIQLPPGTLDAGSRRYCICIAGHEGGCP